MKLERIARVRTPDGEEHENAGAARAHMQKASCKVLGNANAGHFELIADGETSADLQPIREALRDVFLAAWPRASKGKPRAAPQMKKVK